MLNNIGGARTRARTLFKLTNRWRTIIFTASIVDQVRPAVFRGRRSWTSVFVFAPSHCLENQTPHTNPRMIFKYFRTSRPPIICLCNGHVSKIGWLTYRIEKGIHLCLLVGASSSLSPLVVLQRQGEHVSKYFRVPDYPEEKRIPGYTVINMVTPGR